jgi:hypothetical protein
MFFHLLFFIWMFGFFFKIRLFLRFLYSFFNGLLNNPWIYPFMWLLLLHLNFLWLMRFSRGNDWGFITFFHKFWLDLLNLKSILFFLSIVGGFLMLFFGFLFFGRNIWVLTGEGIYIQNTLFHILSFKEIFQLFFQLKILLSSLSEQIRKSDLLIVAQIIEILKKALKNRFNLYLIVILILIIQLFIKLILKIVNILNWKLQFLGYFA